MKKYRIKEDVFVEAMNALEMTYASLAGEAHVAQGSITNALSGGVSLGKIEAIGRALKGEAWRELVVDADRQRLNPAGRRATYTVGWKELCEGARQIGKRLFDPKGASRINTILTFPGPSLIFAGLVMVKALPLDQVIQTPVYTALFVKKLPRRNTFRDFDRVPVGRFTLLVPKSLLQDYPSRERRIAVLDDSVKTGKTMDALRDYFNALERKPASWSYVCYVCHHGRGFLEETTPIYRHMRPENRFVMPWGPAFAFEDCFSGKNRAVGRNSQVGRSPDHEG